jgi:hypothetical protein
MTGDDEKSGTLRLSDDDDDDIDDDSNDGSSIKGGEMKDAEETDEEEEDDNKIDDSATTNEESFELDDEDDDNDGQSDESVDVPGGILEDENDDDGGHANDCSNDDVAEMAEEDDENEEDNDGPQQSQLEAWTQVHQELQWAVAIAREAVESKKMQRRFWLETICANLTENGKLARHSVWKRPVAPKRGGGMPKQTITGPKRTKKAGGKQPLKGSASAGQKRPLSSMDSDSDDDDDMQESGPQQRRFEPGKASPYDEDSQGSTDDDDYDEDTGNSETETSSTLKFPMHHSSFHARSSIQHPYMAAARSSITSNAIDQNPYIAAAEAAKEAIYSTFGAVAAGSPPVEDSESEEDPF